MELVIVVGIIFWMFIGWRIMKALEKLADSAERWEGQQSQQSRNSGRLWHQNVNRETESNQLGDD